MFSSVADLSYTDFVVTAYAGTGKDTLYKQVRAGQLAWVPPTGETANTLWVVYASKERDLTDIVSLLSCAPHVGAFDARRAPPRAIRYAFADPLKQETHEWLNISGDVPALAFEKVKDTLQALNPETGKMETMRAHYINYGQRCRKKDPLVWAKIVAAKVKANKHIDYPSPSPIGITTDWRFDNELVPREKLPSTVRLFREEVKIAPKLKDRTIDSEHNLDEYLTDYLFVLPGEFEVALKLFPQYVHYVPRLFIIGEL